MANNSRIHGDTGNPHSYKNPNDQSTNPFYPTGNGDSNAYDASKPYPYPYANPSSVVITPAEHWDGRNQGSGTDDYAYHNGYKDGFTDRDSLENSMADYRDPDAKAPEAGLAPELHDIQFDFYYKGRLWSIRGALSDTGTLNIRPEQDGRLIIELAGMDE